MKLKFTGSALEFWAVSLLLVFVSFFTMGLVLPFMIYWQGKYFIEHTDIIQ